MASSKSMIVLIEDDAQMARIFQEYLKREPYEVSVATTGEEGLSLINSSPPDAILLDLKLPDMSGLEILTDIKARGIPSAVIVITSDASLNTAVEAMKLGAADFIAKPFNRDRLVYTLRNTLERQELTRQVTRQTEEFDDGHFCGFIGSSLPMRAVYRTIESCAASNATVFITGQSGTGKEVCAEAIHSLGNRSKKPFVPLNCAAIPKDLMESEVFGHVKGAFTGAVADRDGAAIQADGGTLFLDEICEMDINLQAKLLRFVQTGTFLKIGGEKSVTVDVRFICATNKDPWTEVQEGRFREDLYYRLFVIPLAMPALRERDEDVLLIARHFLKQYAKEEGKAFSDFSQSAAVIIANFEWPGNVRQLQNVIRNTVVLNEGDIIEAKMLPEPFDGSRASTFLADKSKQTQSNTFINPLSQEGITPMWRVEWDHIKNAVEFCDGNIPKAAAMLEVSPSTIYRRIKEMEDRS